MSDLRDMPNIVDETAKMRRELDELQLQVLSSSGGGGMIKRTTIPAQSYFTPSSWVDTWKTSSSITLDANKTYLVIANTAFTEGKGEYTLRFTPSGGTAVTLRPYNSNGTGIALGTQTTITTGSTGYVTCQAGFRGDVTGTRWDTWQVSFIPMEW